MQHLLCERFPQSTIQSKSGQSTDHTSTTRITFTDKEQNDGYPGASVVSGFLPLCLVLPMPPPRLCRPVGNAKSWVLFVPSFQSSVLFVLLTSPLYHLPRQNPTVAILRGYHQYPLFTVWFLTMRKGTATCVVHIMVLDLGVMRADVGELRLWPWTLTRGDVGGTVSDSMFVSFLNKRTHLLSSLSFISICLYISQDKERDCTPPH